MLKAFGRYKGHDGSSIGNLMVFETERRSLQVTGALIPLLVKTPLKIMILVNLYVTFMCNISSHIFPNQIC